MWRAARSSPSGASGCGGVTEGMRIRSRRSSMSASIANAQAGPSIALEGAAMGVIAARDRPQGRDDPDDEPAEHERHDHREEKLAVVAILLEAGFRVRVAAAGDVWAGRGPWPGRSGPAASRTRRDREGGCRSWRHDAFEQRTAHREAIRERPVARPGIDRAHREVVRVVARLEDLEAVARSPSGSSRASARPRCRVPGGRERPRSCRARPSGARRPGRMQAGVADDPAGGAVLGDDETLVRDRRLVDLAGPELGRRRRWRSASRRPGCRRRPRSATA